METVTVNITRSSVLADMKVKSHAETAVIADPTERYIAELGSDKTQEAQQCITDAATEVTSVLRKFLSGYSGTETATDTYDTTATITYTLSVSTRRAPGLADVLTKAIHAYIVDSALNKFYISVARADFAERRASKLAAELAVIKSLLYKKFEPTYTA